MAPMHGHASAGPARVSFCALRSCGEQMTGNRCEGIAPAGSWREACPTPVAGVLHPWHVGPAVQWSDVVPKASLARRGVIRSKATQTGVGLAVALCISAGVGVMAKPPAPDEAS